MKNVDFLIIFLPYLEKWISGKFPDYFGFGALPTK
jgi:hypothetical protein